MAPHADDTNPPGGYDETTPQTSNSEPPKGGCRKLPTGRKATRGKPAISDIAIARIETVTMTATEYADAVEALAVLIARWEREHANTGVRPTG